MQRIHLTCLVAVAALALTACSGGGLTTGSLLSGLKAAEKPAEAVNDPSTRAMHAGATSARATKCGYNFDATRLREAFIAAEARQGLGGPELAKAQNTFDFTRSEIAKRIAGDQDYCNEARTAEVKTALTKLLAGDFTPPAPKRAVVAGPDISSQTQPMNREEIFNPGIKSKGVLQAAP